MKIALILIFISQGVLSAPIFDDDSIIEIKLKFNMKRFQNEKETLRKKGLRAELINQLDNEEYPVEILSRGKGSFSCQQPQLKVRFNKEKTRHSIFEGLKKVKLFTQGSCLDTKTDKTQDLGILSNYLIYKLYEEISSFSFKTRLLRINYTDTSGMIKSYSQYGFFLEPKKNLEKRLNLKYVKKAKLKVLKERIPSLINREAVEIVNAFEFLISNYDYGIPGFYSHIINDEIPDYIHYEEKNTKIYQTKSKELIPFIYDFDFSSFIYGGPICMLGSPFFKRGYDGPVDCSVEYLKDKTQKDLEKFKYKSDFFKHREKLISGLLRWQNKNRELLKELGPKYNEGLFNQIRMLEILEPR